MKCYECEQLPWHEEHFPYCSKLCREVASEKLYPRKGKTLEEKLERWKF